MVKGHLTGCGLHGYSLVPLVFKRSIDLAFLIFKTKFFCYFFGFFCYFSVLQTSNEWWNEIRAQNFLSYWNSTLHLSSNNTC